MRLENSFDVPAAPQVAWRVLNDVPRVLPCMPGAELDEIVDENTFKVTMHVKVGAVSMRMKSEVRRTEVDDAAHKVVLVADAKDEKGRGGAVATITSSLEPAAKARGRPSSPTCSCAARSRASAAASWVRLRAS
jgi:Uncharacterized conserved protein